MSSRRAKTNEEKANVVDEIHAPARRNFARRKTIVKGLYDLWQADLAQMDMYSKDNNGYKYILVIICCFSKFVWAVALKDKSGKSVADALEPILKASKRTPKLLQTDKGKEFYNTHVKKLLKQYNIAHNSTHSTIKCAFCERVIRTLKTELWKHFSRNGSYNWIDDLDEIVHDYNNRKHSAIKIEPCNVNARNEKRILRQHFRKKRRLPKPKFKVNDSVRISKHKREFEKGYTPNWSTEIFTVYKVLSTNPRTYLLKDYQDHEIDGCFYEQELKKTKYPDIYLVEKVIKRQNNKCLVKYLGFDSSHNQWIPLKDIFG